MFVKKTLLLPIFALLTFSCVNTSTSSIEDISSIDSSEISSENENLSSEKSNESSSFEVSSEEEFDEETTFSYPDGNTGYKSDFVRESLRKTIDKARILEFGSYTNKNTISFNWSGTDGEIYDYVIVEVSSEGLPNRKYYVYESDHISIRFKNVDCQYSFRFTPYQQNVESETFDTVRYITDPTYKSGLPILKVTTGKHKGIEEDRKNTWPTADYVTSPLEEKWGPTLINNEYVTGSSVNLTNNNGECVFQGNEAKLKLRGNSSAWSNGKKPFKLKLNEKYDLLKELIKDRATDGKDHSHKEWVLLAKGTQVLDYIGFLTSKYIGQEYTPSTAYIDLYVNGEYQGIYLLTEAIARGEERINVSESGFIIENDGLYWAEDVVFKTQLSTKGPVAFSFKYPDSDNITSESAEYNYIKEYVETFENYFYSDDSRYLDYVDEMSFVRWIAAHDLLGSWDSGGSNMFISKYDNTSESKLKAGPIWDLDSAGMMPYDSYARIRYNDFYYIKEFFNKPSFVDFYNDLLKDKLPNYISYIWSEILTLNTESIDLGIDQDAKRWALSEYKNIEIQISEFLIYLDQRVSFLNSEIK